MKKLLVLSLIAALALPVAASAAVLDDVDIDPVVVDFCGTGEVEISGEFYFASGLSNSNRKFELKLDGVIVDSDDSNPIFQTLKFKKKHLEVGVGEHLVEARTYTTFLGAGTKATDSLTFTVEECPPPPPPVDVCSNIDGDQETVPEGYTEEGGICTPEDNGGGGGGDPDPDPDPTPDPDPDPTPDPDPDPTPDPDPDPTPDPGEGGGDEGGSSNAGGSSRSGSRGALGIFIDLGFDLGSQEVRDWAKELFRTDRDQYELLKLLWRFETFGYYGILPDGTKCYEYPECVGGVQSDTLQAFNALGAMVGALQD